MNLLRRPGRRSPQGQLDRLRTEHADTIARLEQRHADDMAKVTARLDALTGRTAHEVRRLHGEVSRVNRLGARVERRVTAVEQDRANERSAGDWPDLTETQPTSTVARDRLIARNTSADLRDRLGPGSGMHLTDKPEPVQWGADITPIQEAAVEVTQELRAAKGVA